MKTFSNHKVTNLDDLKEGQQAKQILSQLAPPPTCKIHDEPMKVFCYECKYLICRDCVLDGHIWHKYEFVRKAAPIIKQKLAEHLTPLKKVQVSLYDFKKAIQSTKLDVEAQGASAATSIEQSFQQLHDILEEHKRHLLQKSSSLVKGKIEQLGIQEKGTDMTLNMIQSLVEFVEQKIENVTDEELMSIHMQVLNRIDEETKRCQQSSTAFELVEMADIVVEIGCAEKLKKLCSEKAIVVSSSINPFKSALQGEGLNSAEISMPSKVILHTVYYSSKKSQDMPIVVKAKLSSTFSQSIVQAEVKQREKNTYEIEYTPSTRGRHLLEVTVNCLSVAGSPFPVFVKIPPTKLGKPLKVYPGFKGFGLAFNSDNEMVFAERDGDILLLDKDRNQSHRIRKSQHGFQSLYSVAIDDKNSIYVTDTRGKSVIKFDKYGTKVKAIKPAVRNFAPRGIAVSGNQVIVADETNCQLFYFTNELELQKKINSHGHPAGLACDQDGKVYVCDYAGNHIRVLSAQGELMYSFSQKDSRAQKLSYPHSICIRSGFVYVTEWGARDKACVSIFTTEGKFITSFGDQGEEKDQLKMPCGLAIDSDGILFVCDYENSCILLY